MALTKITPEIVAVNAIQGTLIADNAITTVHIANNAVESINIAENNVTAREIAANIITVTQLADDAVEADKIADGVITTNHLNKAMISSQTEVAVATGDYVLLGDTSDSNNLKKAPISSILAGTLTTAAQTAITSVGTLSSLTLGGDLTMGSNQIIFNNNSQAIQIKDAAGTASYVLYQDNADTLVVGNGTNVEKIRLDTGGNEGALVIDTSGNVGIGRSSPNANSALEVNGRIRLATGSDALPALSCFDDLDTGIVFPGSNVLTVVTAGTERMRIDAAGDLTLKTAGKRYYIPRASDAAATGSLYSPTGNEIRLSGAGSGSGVLSFEPSSGSGVAMHIASDGKIIIGDTASHTTDLLQIETPASGGGHGIQIRRNDANTDQVIGHILFGNNTDTDLVKISAKTDGDSNAGDSGALIFGTQATGGVITDRMLINSTGNVGIGVIPTSLLHLRTTSAASYPLTIEGDVDNDGGYTGIQFGYNGNNYNKAAIHVEGTSGNVQPDMHFLLNSAASSANASLSDARLTILNNGNVGIGTTSPTLKLDVEESTSTWIADFVNTNSTPYGLRIQCQGNTPGTSLIFGAYSSAGDGVSINNNGMMGIGTFNPATELQIGDYTDNAETLTFATASDQTGRINFYNNNASEGASMRVVGGGNGAKMHFANRYDSDADKVTFDLVNGRVGIGTTGPSTELHLYKSNGNPTLYFENSDTATDSGDFLGKIEFKGNDGSSNASGIRAHIHGGIQNTSGGAFLAFGVANSSAAVAEAMRIQADGKVGIGTGSNTVGGLLETYNSANYTKHWRIHRPGTAEFGIGTVGAHLHISSGSSMPATSNKGIFMEFNTGKIGIHAENSGNHPFLVDIRSGSYGMLVKNNSYHADRGCYMTEPPGNTTYQAMVYLNSSGSNVGRIEVSSNSATYNTSSDYRLKTNVTTLENGLSRVNQLKPVKFDWIFGGETDEGFIAHEVEGVFPYAVRGEKDAVNEEGGIQGQQMDYGKLTPLLVKAIQELKTELDAAKARIATLEG